MRISDWSSDVCSSDLLDSTYGQLLALKVALFAAMLVFAALNRFHLSPLLELARQTGEHSTAVNALRRSMVLELSVAVGILALVAWLGTLSPEKIGRASVRERVCMYG